MPSFEMFEAYARRVELEMTPNQRAASDTPRRKRCPDCSTECELGATECPMCGHEFPITPPRLNRKTNTVTITSEGLLRFEIFLNDALVDLNNEITILIEDGAEPIEFFKGKVERSLSMTLNELVASNHPWRVYPVRFDVDMPTVRAQEAERIAAAKAAAGAQGGPAPPPKVPGADDKGKEAGKGKGLSAPPSKASSK